MSRSVPVLILDSDPTQRRLISAHISAAGGSRFSPLVCESPDEAIAHAGDRHILIADIDSVGGVARLAALAGSSGPMIATSREGSVSVAIEAMRAGAVDFVTKPVGAKALIDRLDRAIAAWSQAPAAAAPPAARSNASQDDEAFAGFIGETPAMRAVFEQIRRVAASRAPVFLSGESGTGKELCAEAIHRLSGGKALVAINCSAIPRELIESEIFGHVRGAFTGAIETRIGAAELAHGGTLFLDEICEMDLSLQAKLLRFVQTGVIRRVGEGEARPVETRIVAATNRDPQVEVASGRFRADLYYRLQVLPIELPPLRERREDIPRLAEAFLKRFAAEEGRGPLKLSDAARTRLAAYDWPGNVRQLQNLVRRIAVLHVGDTIEAEDLPADLVTGNRTPIQPMLPAEIRPFWIEEKRIIESAIAACGGNVGKAAAELGLSASTIYRKRLAWAAGEAG